MVNISAGVAAATVRFYTIGTGVELRGGRGKYAKVLFSWDGKNIRQGDSRYSTALYNSDGQYIRKGEDKYSQPLMNISGPVPAAVLIYILLL